MGADGGVVGAEDLGAVFALDGQPVLLPAGAL
jgi:hypothetical protein